MTEMLLSEFDPIAYINEPRWQHVSLGLDRMRTLLSKLGNPQNRFKSIHVAGTNGKGSVCSYLSSILSSAGFKTGLFTSPYVFEFAERIRIDAQMIDDRSLIEITLKVRDAALEVEVEGGEHPTEFELMFAVACCYFAIRSCDICVIECGLGGRLDATNVISPILSIITPISLDHTAILGDTIAKIATEKAGIIKERVPVVAWLEEPDVEAVLVDACAWKECDLYSPDPSATVLEPIDLVHKAREFTYEGVRYTTRLLGSYQPANASIAIEAVNVLSAKCGIAINSNVIVEGVARAIWPGRFEVIGEDPLVIFDGGHNVQGAKALVSSLRSIGVEDNSVVFVSGVLTDKDYEGMLETIAPLASVLYTFAPDSPRALDSTSYAHAAREIGIDAIAKGSALEAMESALDIAGPENIICAFGSLYSIGSLKEAIEMCD